MKQLILVDSNNDGNKCVFKYTLRNELVFYDTTDNNNSKCIDINGMFIGKILSDKVEEIAIKNINSIGFMPFHILSTIINYHNKSFAEILGQYSDTYNCKYYNIDFKMGGGISVKPSNVYNHDFISNDNHNRNLNNSNNNINTFVLNDLYKPVVLFANKFNNIWFSNNKSHPNLYQYKTHLHNLSLYFDYCGHLNAMRIYEPSHNIAIFNKNKNGVLLKNEAYYYCGSKLLDIYDWVDNCRSGQLSWAILLSTLKDSLSFERLIDERSVGNVYNPQSNAISKFLFSDINFDNSGWKFDRKLNISELIIHQKCMHLRIKTNLKKIDEAIKNDIIQYYNKKLVTLNSNFILMVLSFENKELQNKMNAQYSEVVKQKVVVGENDTECVWIVFDMSKQMLIVTCDEFNYDN